MPWANSCEAPVRNAVSSLKTCVWVGGASPIGLPERRY